jgi:hypothetical protein
MNIGGLGRHYLDGMFDGKTGRYTCYIEDTKYVVYLSYSSVGNECATIIETDLAPRRKPRKRQ